MTVNEEMAIYRIYYNISLTAVIVASLARICMTTNGDVTYVSLFSP